MLSNLLTVLVVVLCVMLGFVLGPFHTPPPQLSPPPVVTADGRLVCSHGVVIVVWEGVNTAIAICGAQQRLDNHQRTATVREPSDLERGSGVVVGYDYQPQPASMTP